MCCAPLAERENHISLTDAAEYLICARVHDEKHQCEKIQSIQMHRLIPIHTQTASNKEVIRRQGWSSRWLSSHNDHSLCSPLFQCMQLWHSVICPVCSFLNARAHTHKQTLARIHKTAFVIWKIRCKTLVFYFIACYGMALIVAVLSSFLFCTYTFFIGWIVYLL